MKKLLLIVFKIIEATLFLAVCKVLQLLLTWGGLLDWFDCTNTTWIIVLFILWIISAALWVYVSFKPWIALNKEWVDKILKK